MCDEIVEILRYITIGCKLRQVCPKCHKDLYITMNSKHFMEDIKCRCSKKLYKEIREVNEKYLCDLHQVWRDDMCGIEKDDFMKKNYGNMGPSKHKLAKEKIKCVTCTKK